MNIQFGDRVKVINPNYACAKSGDTGTIVDHGYPTYENIIRYLVRWDSSPDMLWGVHSDCIERVEG